MAIEIEAKVAVKDHEMVRARLRDCGAESDGSCLETNVFFDTEDRSLLAADQGLRLRKRRDDQSKVETFTITYKGPRRHGQLKSRDEVELDVASDRDTFTLFSRLGYQRILSFEKKRESWKLNDCRVELDEVPHVGRYVEIEGPTEVAVLKVRDLLQLDGHPLVKTSYVALLMTYLQDQADSNRSITFQA